VKTAISLPDETFRRVDRCAKELGISRSEFFATAAERYLSELDAASVTLRIDEAVDAVGLDTSWQFAVHVGQRTLTEQGGEEW
jgi:predicted DNA-binding protein